MGGGRTAAGQWGPVRHGLLVPVRVVMAGCRGKRRDAVRWAWTCGAVTRPEAMRPQPLLNLRRRLGPPRKTTWHVHIRER